MLTEEDVYSVAKSIGLNPTPEQVKQALEMYPSAQEDDPSGNWSYVIEQVLHDLDVE